METRRLTFLELLTEAEDARFIVPKWQRHYVWEAAGPGGSEVSQLWDDIMELCRVGHTHFCGVILLHEFPDAGGMSWEIVDGQQRLTTLFVLFLALRDYCQEHGIDFTSFDKFFLTPKARGCRLVLQEGLNDDRLVLNALLQGTSSLLEEQLKTESKLHLAYLFFKTKIDSTLAQGTQAFVEATLQHLDFLILRVDPSDDTRRIFETLNARGKLMDPEDLIRNLITFIGDENHELTEKAQRIWFYVSELEKDDLEQFLDTFGKRNGKQTARGTAFEEIKFEIERARQTDSLDAWLNEFKRAARNFQEILFPDDSDDPIQLLLAEIKRLRVPRLNPFLLALLDTFRDTPASAPLIHNIRSLIVRMLISHDRPAARIEKFAEKACEAFFYFSVPREERLEMVIRLIDETWIDDAEFSHKFVTKNVYGPGANLSRLRYYLEKLEQKLAEEASTPFVSSFGPETTVEHIMPQTLDASWKLALRMTDQNRLVLEHKSLVDSIGNLTVLLMKKNSEVQNGSYAEKRLFYTNPNEALAKAGIRTRGKLGNCALNGYFEDVRQWNFAAITQRGQVLANLALTIWTKEDWNRGTK